MSTQQMPDTERYMEFLQCIEISNISIVSVQASRLPNFKRPPSGNLLINSKVSLDSLTPKTLRALVSAKTEGTNDKKEPLFSCDLALAVDYSFARQVGGLTDDKELVERFVGTNVMVNAWPYIREYVAWLTTNMSVGTALIPLLKARQESPKSDET